MCYNIKQLCKFNLWRKILMRTYLVTGGAGFIGSNYIHYMFRKYDNEIRIINVDCLTYAGNLENLKDVENYLKDLEKAKIYLDFAPKFRDILILSSGLFKFEYHLLISPKVISSTATQIGGSSSLYFFLK